MSARVAILDGLGAIDPAAQAWFDAVAAAGGSVSRTWKKRVNNFLTAERACGALALMVDYNLYGAETIEQAKVSLIRRAAVTLTGCTFVPSRHIATDGVGDVIKPGMVPSTHGAGLLDGNNQRMAAYNRANVNSNTTAYGAFTSATVNMKLVTRTGTTIAATLNSGTATFTIVTGAGYSVISRAGGATTMKAYKNGAKLTDVTGLTVGTTAPTIAPFVGARNNAGTADNFNAGQFFLTCIGAPLTSDTMEAAHYANVQALAAAAEAAV